MPATSGIWNPKAYGATYNGQTDDHTAVQKAIDLCSAAGGGTVAVTGQVFTTSTIVLKPGVLLDLAHWTVQGPANPVIGLPPSGGPDRMGLRGGVITSTTGDGIQLITSGAWQLGWPRITVEGTTLVECAGRGVVTGLGSIETRLINVVTLRCVGWGFEIAGTDSMLIGCTAAAGSSRGFAIQGGNHKLTACKAYGNGQQGFVIEGAGRHMLASCEAQDNAWHGFTVASDWNTLSACLADSNRTTGFNVEGSNNTIAGGAAMYGGGGSGQVTPVGFLLSGARNVVAGTTNCATPVDQDSGTNHRTILSQGATSVID